MISCVVVSLVAWMAARHVLQEFVNRRRQAAEEHAALLVRLGIKAVLSKCN
jgi:hypothetical protein